MFAELVCAAEAIGSCYLFVREILSFAVI